MPGVIGNAAAAAYAVVDRAWTAACWPLIAILNFLFRPVPRSGAVSLWRVAIWPAVNAALLYLAVMQLSPPSLFFALLAFLILHIQHHSSRSEASREGAASPYRLPWAMLLHQGNGCFEPFGVERRQ